jgi:tRNA(Ile)-lysidine synthase
MKENFFNSLKNSSLTHQKILLAVSGGVDSMVMLHLFLESRMEIGVAHCNFQLRGKDSLEDEKFVLSETSKYGIKSHVIRFETENYAEKTNLSIQMAARELRYNWFEQIRKEFNYDYIATAHHSDDTIETFFLNLLRKTGISGLHGIKNISGNIIRPLLFTNKEEILKYADNHNITYREDASNTDNYYKRNYIRHHIIPEFKKLNPNFTKTLLDSINILSKQETVYKEHINNTIQSFLTVKNDMFTIEIDKIKHLQPLDIYLFECLSPLGFNHAQVNDIIQCLDTTEEKVFISSTNRLLKTRNTLEITVLDKNETKTVFINNLDKKSFISAGICIEIKDFCPNFIFDKNPSVAYFDLDKISFPLQIRSWQDGDFFYPFGGKGKKKLSGFFAELKLNSIEKQKTRLLCNKNGDILWVIGIRSDNRYKVSASIQKILMLKTVKAVKQ